MGHAGQAVADVIFGAFAPIGRVTQTWYKANYANEVSIFDVNMQPNNETGYPGRGYRYYNGDSINFPVGFGLSYTTFSCSSVDSSNVNSKGQLSVTVTNSGNINSGGVVLVFWVPNDAGKGGVENQRLVGFEQFDMVAPSQNITVAMDVYKEFLNGQEFQTNYGSYVAGGVCQSS